MRKRIPRARPADVVAADEGLLGTLDALDRAVNYRNWILGLAEPFLRDAQEILEVGAGHGTFTVELSQVANVTALELGSEALARLRERFLGDATVSISDESLAQLAADRFDVAFLSNVLEHIEGDVEALSQLARVVKPAGYVIVFSPAFRLLYSEFDATIGHHHRYRLEGLRQKFRSAGLDVVEARYVNLVGFFSWFLMVRLLRITPENQGAVRVFDRWFVPWLRILERMIRVPFGQSVFVVGRVPAGR